MSVLPQIPDDDDEIILYYDPPLLMPKKTTLRELALQAKALGISYQVAAYGAYTSAMSATSNFSFTLSDFVKIFKEVYEED